MTVENILDDIHESGIYGIFGKPRAGKTTLSAGIVQINNKRKAKGKGIYFDRIYSTDETIKGVIPITYKQFGHWDIKDNSLIILEECGIGLNNRKWKEMDDEQKRTIAMIGHHKSTILWSSQTADIDKTLRVRTHKLYQVEKYAGQYSLITDIEYQFGVNNEMGTLEDRYHIPEGLRDVLKAILHKEIRLFRRKPFYKMFDSYKDEYEYTGRDPEEEYASAAK